MSEEKAPLRKVTVEEFMELAVRSPVREAIDQHLELIQRRSRNMITQKKQWRQMAFLLREISLSLPWDTKAGLDAVRMDSRNNTVVPTWRECIGHVLALSFKPAEDDDSEEKIDALEDQLEALGVPKQPVPDDGAAA